MALSGVFGSRETFQNLMKEFLLSRSFLIAVTTLKKQHIHNRFFLACAASLFDAHQKLCCNYIY